MAKICVIATRCPCRDELPYGAKALTAHGILPGHQVALWDGAATLREVDLVVAVHHPRSGPGWGLLVAGAVETEIPMMFVVQERHHHDFLHLLHFPFMQRFALRNSMVRNPYLYFSPNADRPTGAIISAVLDVLRSLPQPQPA